MAEFEHTALHVKGADALRATGSLCILRVRAVEEPDQIGDMQRWRWRHSRLIQIDTPPVGGTRTTQPSLRQSHNATGANPGVHQQPVPHEPAALIPSYRREIVWELPWFALWRKGRALLSGETLPTLAR